MVKTRAQSSQSFAASTPLPCPTSTPPPSLSPYESLRLQRIAENQARMAALGVQKQLENISFMFKATKAKTVKKRLFEKKPPIPLSPVRRSERLKGVPPTDYISSFIDEETGVIRGSKKMYKLQIRLKVPRSANASMPKSCPTELQISPAVLAFRCLSKGRGTLYDPIVGICCHFCRQKKLCGEEDCQRCGNRDVSKPCLGKTDCTRCHSSTGVFCRACLKVRYGEDMEEVRESNTWICPHCIEEEGIKPYWICNSSICLSKRKIAPTGIAIYKAREMGFKSVAHYLADYLKRMR